jgi:ketosteroid isomerase-like protein
MPRPRSTTATQVRGWRSGPRESRCPYSAAWRSEVGQEAVRDLFHNLADTFSNCTSHAYEIVAADVVGDIAFTVGYERTQASINGEPRRYVLRVTQVYRREDGEWKVAHRHADTAPDSDEADR